MSEVRHDERAGDTRRAGEMRPGERTGVAERDGDSRTSSGVFYTRLGAVFLLAVLLYLVWQIVAPLWQPLVAAALLGALLAPVNARLTRRLGGRAQLASALTTFGVVVLVLLPIVAIGGAVASQAGQLLQQIDTRSLQPDHLDLGRYPFLERPLQWIETTADVSLSQIEGWVVNGAKRLLETLASSGGAVMLGAIGTLIRFVLTLFVLFFVLRDGQFVAGKVLQALPIEARLRQRLWRHLIDVTRAVFMGIGATAVAQGVLLGIGFAITGLPSPLVFAVLGTLFALVPVVGTAIVWVPATLWLLAQGHPGYAVFMVIWCTLVVGIVDNLLRPILISGRVEVPTLAVFVGVMGGLSAFGFIGLFVGPIVLGLLVALFRFTTEDLAPAARAED
jgi:predicted PurR-regulated permease PerM